MKPYHTYKTLFLSLVFSLLGFVVANAQFLLQAPNSGGENNYQWYEASDTNTVLGTDFFLEVTQQGVYFATYDGTLCGSNATGYFIVTNCNSPFNEVIMDISANVPSGATVSWSPAVTGDQTRPQVIATQTVQRYTATITKAGNDSKLPNFTIVCINEAATLVDDLVTVNEDESVIVDIFANDSDLPATGTLTTTNPSNGTVTIDNNGTPNNPTDDIVTYIPNPDYNGPDTFDYTVCNTFGDCSTATVTIDVLPIVDAIDDSIATTKNTPVDIDILGNDNDLPSVGTLTTTNPSNGTVVINDNGTPNDPSDDSVTYTPNNNFIGTDIFSYTICDNQGNCSTATVTILVTDVADIDSDDDGIVDSFEDLNLDNDNDPSTNVTDTDNDGIADYLDIDSDNDNVPDNIEAHDTDHDGIPDVTLIGSDKDNDGLDDGYEGNTSIDVDVNDEFDDPYNDLPNTDGDNESDYRDTDDDNDGIESKDEDTNGDGNYANDDNDGNGIPDYLEINVLEDEIEVFNVITPNGDGTHDVLTIAGLENYPNNTLRIYNRWGVLVFSTSAYNTQGNVFDGTSNGRVTVDVDNKLPVGTYFYILDYENTTGNMISLSGYLYLNR